MDEEDDRRLRGVDCCRWPGKDGDEETQNPEASASTPVLLCCCCWWSGEVGIVCDARRLVAYCQGCPPICGFMPIGIPPPPCIIGICCGIIPPGMPPPPCIIPCPGIICMGCIGAICIGC
jgi:hypothetical protein